MKRIILLTLTLIIFASAMLAFWQRHFLYRASTYPHDAPVTTSSWYEPLAQVSGQSINPWAVSKKSATIFDRAMLDSIADYAGERNSTALLVAFQDSLVMEWYRSDSGPTATTNSMSLVKSIVALLVGVAIDQHWIQSIEDPVSKYIVEWQDPERAKISIRHLLEMNSGLERYDDQSDPFSDLVQLYLGQDVNGTALHVPATSPPGEKFEYNNANTQLLGILLARTSGLSFRNLLATYIWQPIGASDAALFLDVPGGNARAFCCFFATARDWLRVGQLYLNGGSYYGKQLVSAQWIDQITTASAAEGDYGLHLWLGYKPDGRHSNLRSEPYAASDVYYMAGQDYQRVYVIPSTELVIVRVGELPQDWDDAWITNRLIRSVQKHQRGK